MDEDSNLDSKVNNDFLDRNILLNYAMLIEENNIFMNDPQYKNVYNLLCAITDRLDSSIVVLNNIGDKMKSEDDFILFMVHACFINDAINEISGKSGLNIEKDIESSEIDPSAIFRRDIIASSLNITEDNCPSDKEFFAYLRAISTMHPFETSRQTFLKVHGEKHISPFPIVKSKYGHGTQVGARIYSTNFEDIIDLLIPLESVKDYILSRYLLLNKISEKMQEIIATKEATWREKKVSTTLRPIDALHEVRKKLVECYKETDSVDKAIMYLDYPLTNVENQENVCLYQKAIIDIIPQLVEAVNDLDFEQMEILLKVVRRPNKDQHNYALEKIFGYIDKKDEYPDKYEFAIEQAESVANSFANNWVTIDCKKMHPTEIKLLLLTAFYLEKEKNYNDSKANVTQ